MSDFRQTKAAFDRDIFLSNFHGMDDLISETISSFFTALPDLTSAIETAIREKNLADLELAAHTLKGVVANFYAEPSKLLAWKLEQIGHGQLNEDCEIVFRQLQVELSRLTNELQNLVNETKVA